jgi:dihydrofolate reductase
MDGSFRYGAHLLILVLSGSQLLIIKPDEERENNWTKVLGIPGTDGKFPPVFGLCKGRTSAATIRANQGNQMRNVIYAINLTLDGCCDHTKFNPDEDTFEYFIHLLRDEADLLVYGRKTYQLMVPYWPDIAKSQSETKADIEFAQIFVSRKKIVFSRSLASAEDENTRIVRTNLRDEILKLKQEPGKDILVGGVDIPSQLIELGLVDEYRFVVAPIIVGEGRRLMESVSLPEKLQLKLVESKIFESGCVALRYLKQ